MKDLKDSVFGINPVDDLKVTPDEVIYIWLNNYYSIEIISQYLESIYSDKRENAYKQMMETLWEIGADCHATIHYDDPALLELFRELDELKAVIDRAYNSVR